MTPDLCIRIAALLGFFGVALGAFGAHGLKPLLRENKTTSVWEKAVLYHFFHVLALLFLASMKRVPTGVVISFVSGIILFSGSLYLLAVTNKKWLGAITPLGGITFLVGWLWLGFSA